MCILVLEVQGELTKFGPKERSEGGETLILSLTLLVSTVNTSIIGVILLRLSPFLFVQVSVSLNGISTRTKIYTAAEYEWERESFYDFHLDKPPAKALVS